MQQLQRLKKVKYIAIFSNIFTTIFYLNYIKRREEKMQELVILKNKEAVTTSLQVAESFEKKHKHVLEAIESIKRSVENWANVEDGSNFGQMFVEGNEP
ncbi:Rha family transcriptional regulator, partial [Enterococcus lactis]|uniref:Rha family transcriptional regulator n=1 Tax=Enterococcus lactis TaxID=357441 RepID=UPI001ED94315